MTWSQLYVGTKDFSNLFEQLKTIYKEDKLFQKYLKDDCDIFEKEIDQNQENFFLEESLMFYLLSKNKVKLPNEYIENNQKWILFCYPGNPLKNTVYLYQLDPFKLDWKENPYQNSFYNLEDKKLIDYSRVDLDSYQVI